MTLAQRLWKRWQGCVALTFSTLELYYVPPRYEELTYILLLCILKIDSYIHIYKVTISNTLSRI